MKNFSALLIFIFILLCLQSPGTAQNIESSPSTDVEQKIYLKAFNTAGLSEGKTKVQYVQTFSKGKEYVMHICNEKDSIGGLVMSLYNSRRKLLGTNLINGECEEEVVFPCRATGLYYLVFTYQNKEKGQSCESSVLSLRFTPKQ